MRDVSTTVIPAPAAMLIVGDHLRWVEAVADHFRADEAALVVVDDGEEAVDVARRLRPGFVALDVDSLGTSVMQVCRTMREVCDAHVTMWSRAEHENVVVAGLRAGADDVLTGPRTSRELAARARAALRRWRAYEALAGASDAGSQRFAFAALSIDVGRREVRVAGQRIGLTRTQFDVLVELAKGRGAVVTHRDLAQAVWGSSRGGNPECVGVHIGQLRRRLGDDPENPDLVLSVRGVGYRLAVESAGAADEPYGSAPVAAAGGR